jgi:uncharacterized protein
MRLDEVIIITISSSDKRMIAGRTLLQKTLYFINEQLNCGFDFSPHYYGPYSSAISDELANLRASGVIEEKVDTYSNFDFGATFEPRRYTYQLTKLGEIVANNIQKLNEEESEQIKAILVKMKEAGLADDYKNLSVAAKMYHILKIDKRAKASQILNEAKVLNWNINQDEAKAAVGFLETMGLIKVVEKK